jgi:YspA, cpYpsA-related SLOG family
MVEEVMKVLVSGGRKYADRQCVYDTLDWFAQEYGIDLLIHGDATGADRMAKDWAHSHRIETKDCPADWENIKHPQAKIKTRYDGSKYDVTAGFRRNSQMLHMGPDAAIVFPGSNGTQDMLQKIRKANLYCWIVENYGKIRVEGDFPVGTLI